MKKNIKLFSDGTSLQYDRGSFDKWCVYVVSSDGSRKAPKDAEYFKKLKDLATKYGSNKVYSDFVIIYNMTEKDVSEETLNKINIIARTDYVDDYLKVEKLFTILYMAMISEENYPGTKLGRKIKRLAAYEILINKKSVDYATEFMKGMKYNEINELCKERGF